MSEKKQSEIDAERRRERQDAQLRENLKRRKDQARARRSGSPGAGDGPPPTEDGAALPARGAATTPKSYRSRICGIGLSDTGAPLSG